MTFLLSLLSANSGVLLGLATALAAVIGAFIKGRLDGAKLERSKSEKERSKAREVAHEEDNKVGQMTADQARKDLGKWGK